MRRPKTAYAGRRLKAYLKIAGALYTAIGNYGSFRGGIEYLYTDVKRLAESLVSESLFTTRARHQNIRHTEARTGVVGSLELLVDDLTLLESSLGQISSDETARRLKRVKEDAELLLGNVKDEKDHDAIEQELERFAEGLPNRCPHPKDKTPEDAAVLL